MTDGTPDGTTSAESPITQLEHEAAARFFELGPFWSAVQTLSAQEIVDPASALATSILQRLPAGQQFDHALSASVDEVLEGAVRNSL